MRILTLAIAALLCVSCTGIDSRNTAPLSGHISGNQGFIGEWIRGKTSKDGYYSERLVVTQKTAELYEDGDLVLKGIPTVKDDKLIIEADMNNSRYYAKLGGAWGQLRNNDQSLDLFGKIKGLLCFDRKTTEQANALDSK